MLIKTQNLSGQMSNKDGVISCGQPLWQWDNRKVSFEGSEGTRLLTEDSKAGDGAVRVCARGDVCVTSTLSTLQLHLELELRSQP